MRLAVILVHYHTPRLAAAAVEAVRRDLATSGLEAELLLVDNGSDEAGRELLAALPVRHLDPGTNLGYAGGVNLGAAESSAETIVLMNPDVEVVPGCLGALAAELAAGAAAAGPRFFWDHGRRLLLPPPEVRTRAAELTAGLARRGGGWQARARRRWRRHARRHWLATAPLATSALSGALLAVRRDAWRRVGPFDHAYRLYFEETDWLSRLAKSGLASRYVPSASAVHHYARSAANEPSAGDWFAASERRFRRRHYGRPFAALLDRLDRVDRRAEMPRSAPPRLPPGPPRLEVSPSLLQATPPLWVEVSPLAAGFPAAAERLVPSPGSGTRWCLPPEVWAGLAPGEHWLRVVDDAGRELAVHVFVRERDGGG